MTKVRDKGNGGADRQQQSTTNAVQKCGNNNGEVTDPAVDIVENHPVDGGESMKQANRNNNQQEKNINLAGFWHSQDL